MTWFSKKRDPLDAQAKALSAEIQRLEAEIVALAQPGPGSDRTSVPRLRSTAYGDVVLPQRRSAPVEQPPAAMAPAPAIRPVRTLPAARPAVSREPAPSGSLPGLPADPHFNELGVRKYDLVSWWERLKVHLQGPTSNNPRMVQFLAAGSIQGLRPLRYERRIARNRFLVFFGILLLILWGLAFNYLRQRGI